MPRFSVIIPAYNRADLIARTLDSLFNQTLADMEIIVVDDGSTDATRDVVARYGDRVQLLQQANRGPGAARNLGLSVAVGKYVAFLDSDDVWFPWTAATYARVIEQQNSPAFIAGKPFVFHGDNDPLPTQPGELSVKVFDDYYASGDQWRWFSASSFVMQRESLLAVGGFTDDWVNGEDADCAMRMGIAGKFVQITAPFTFGYLEHAGSAMSNLARSAEGILSLINSESAGKFPGGRARQLERMRIISMFSRPLAVALMKQRDARVAWDIYRRIFMWNLRLGNFKFIAVFPLACLLNDLRGGKLAGQRSRASSGNRASPGNRASSLAAK